MRNSPLFPLSPNIILQHTPVSFHWELVLTQVISCLAGKGYRGRQEVGKKGSGKPGDYVNKQGIYDKKVEKVIFKAKKKCPRRDMTFISP